MHVTVNIQCLFLQPHASQYVEIFKFSPDPRLTTPVPFHSPRCCQFWPDRHGFRVELYAPHLPARLLGPAFSQGCSMIPSQRPSLYDAAALFTAVTSWCLDKLEAVSGQKLSQGTKSCHPMHSSRSRTQCMQLVVIQSQCLGRQHRETEHSTFIKGEWCVRKGKAESLQRS